MKKSIAFISDHASPLSTLGGTDSGGQNVYVSELARQLGQLGYQVDIFTRWDDARLPQIVELYQNVRVIHIQAGPKEYVPKENLFPYMKEFTQHMSFFMKRNAYHLIHAHFWMSGYIASQLKKKFAVPFVITFHALGYIRKMHQKEADTFPSERIAIEKQIVKDADHIIAECPQDREDLLLYYNCDRKKITVIPCGCNIHELYPIDKNLAKIHLNIKPNIPVILQLGRLVPRKGIDNVIRAMAELKKIYNSPVQLLVAGGESDEPDPEKTPEIARLRQIMQDAGIEDRVLFVGRKARHEIKKYYSAADIFVTTPWYEPFGMTVLEAMACGTPVIGSNVGGIKYSIIDGKTGYLVPPEAPRALAEKMKTLLENHDLRQQFGQRCFDRIHSLFTWERIGKSMATLYDTTIDSAFPQLSNNRAILERNFRDAADTVLTAQEYLQKSVLDIADALTKALDNGKKVLICGNGGSAAEAQHFAGELVGRYMIDNRPALPVIPLTVDTSTITAWANDYSYESVFSRQVEAFGQEGDILIGLSSSGESPNIIHAIETAHKKKMICISLVGKTGGLMAQEADYTIHVPSFDTARIQEVHLTILHTLCEMIEKALFIQKPQTENDSKIWQNWLNLDNETIIDY